MNDAEQAETSLIAVWDVREPGWWDNREAKTKWLKDHDLPANEMYRVEFHVIDGPLARIWCYHLNDEGRKHWEHRHDPTVCTADHDCGPCTLPPRDVPLSELPSSQVRRWRDTKHAPE